VEDRIILAEYLFPAIPAQYPEPITKAKADIKLVHRCFGYMGFTNVRRTRKIVIGLEFDDTREKTESTRLCDPCEKGRLVREVSRKPQYRETRIRACIYVDIFKIKLTGIRGIEYGILYTNDTSRAHRLYTAKNKNKALQITKHISKYIEI
jgi:hypothetical protein